jgi:hypothetical protein
MKLCGSCAQPVKGELGLQVISVGYHVEDLGLNDRCILAGAVIDCHNGDNIAFANVFNENEIIIERFGCCHRG